MEPNGLPGGIFSGATGMSPGMLRLEMPLHQPLQQKSPQNPNLQIPHHGQPQHQTQLGASAFGSHEGDEDELGFPADDGGNGDMKRKLSPWHRMKWTDHMVKLLIMVVYCIGDEGAASEGNDKKKPGGLLQKKGKWKTVSREMMGKGFSVSPQQCEDKFNDLNKRYKRVNDIIGKGTACKVVENQSLLDTMDHISPKMKEEARKLLNSKHLFFREMCAYHNSCNGGGWALGNMAMAMATHHPADTVPSPSPSQRCSHSADLHTDGPTVNPNLGRAAETDGSKEEYEEDDDENEVDDDDENGQGHDDDYDGNEERHAVKRERREMLASWSPLAQKMVGELAGVVQDRRRSLWEKRQWMKGRLVQLEEQRLGYQCEALQLERQHLKWLKYCAKKEREMEESKLRNERMKLENERMMLLLRHREMELLNLHHHQQQNSTNKMGDPC